MKASRSFCARRGMAAASSASRHDATRTGLMAVIHSSTGAGYHQTARTRPKFRVSWKSMGPPQRAGTDMAQFNDQQMHASSSEAVTNNVRVEVESRYASEHSQPFQGHWAFHYTIRISNEGEDTVQLISR